MKKLSIILIGLLFANCRPVKSVEQTHEKQKDSISYIERVKVDTIKIPGDKIEINLPCDQIRPQSFAQGRGKVKAEPKGNGYTVVFTCDSIEKLVISKDKEINRLSEQLKTSDAKKTIELSFWDTFWIRIGKFLTGVLIAFIIWKTAI